MTHSTTQLEHLLGLREEAASYPHTLQLDLCHSVLRCLCEDDATSPEEDHHHSHTTTLALHMVLDLASPLPPTCADLFLQALCVSPQPLPFIQCAPQAFSHSDPPLRQLLLDTLQELLLYNRHLTVPVLGCLGEMQLTVEQQRIVSRLAEEALSTAEEEDIPVIIRVLLRSLTVENAENLVHKIRELEPQLSESGLLLCVQVLEETFRVSSFAVRVFLKAMLSARACSVMDVFVSILLQSHSSRKERAEACLEKAARRGALTVDTFLNALKHEQVLRKYSPQIVQLLLQNVASSTCVWSSWLPQCVPCLFELYPSCRSELVSGLLFMLPNRTLPPK